MDVKAKRGQEQIDIKNQVAVKPSGCHSKWMSQQMDVTENGCQKQMAVKGKWMSL